MRGAANRLKREHNDRAWLAWQTATIPYQKAPKFRDMLIRDERQRVTAAPSWRDEFAAFAGWAEAKTRH